MLMRSCRQLWKIFYWIRVRNVDNQAGKSDLRKTKYIIKIYLNSITSSLMLTFKNSFINYNMKPLQEFVHEWASINSNAIERKTLVMKEMDAMPCKITLLRNGQIVDTKQLNLGIKEQENLITEGINLLLQRLLILERRTTASMIVQSISYTGKVVRAKYVCLKFRVFHILDAH